MKTLIAIPCMDYIPFQFAQSLLWMEKGENVSILFKPNSLVYDSRNLISLTAIENNYDRVMWFDSDMMFMPDTMKRLHADMDAYINCEMVTGLYVKRHSPVKPVIYERLDEPTTDKNGILSKNIVEFDNYPRNDFFTVKGCGFGCVMTSTKLLREVWNRFGPAFTPYPWAGEDISFCHRVNQLGYNIYCDSRITCGHIGTAIYTEDMLKRGDYC